MANDDRPSLTVLIVSIIGFSYCVQNVCAQINRSHSNQNSNDNVADTTSSQTSPFITRDTSSQPQTTDDAAISDNNHSRHGNEEALSGDNGMDVIYSLSNNDNIHRDETGGSDVSDRSLPRVLVQTAPQAFNEVQGGSVFSNQASMPTTRASFPSDPAARLHQLLERRRNRERRVLNIRQIILRSTGYNNRPPNMDISQHDRLAALSRFSRLNPNWRPARQTEEHCYKATCALPESTNTLLWSNESQPVLRLYFSVPRLNRRGKSQQKELDQARLKLYVKPRTDCPPCQDGDSVPRPHNLLVMVYQFIRPLCYRKRNRIVYRREILDTAAVSVEGNAWVDLDIKRAVNLWMTRSRKNFGLEIVVSYMNGTLLDAKNILSLPRCEDGAVRSCREDRDNSVERDFWSSLTLAEDTEPYIDVVTGTRAHILFPSFNQSSVSLQLPRLRTTRSVSMALSEKRDDQKIVQKFPLFKKGHKDFMQALISQGAKSKNAEKKELASMRRNVLQRMNGTISHSYPETCSCHPKQPSHPNDIEKLQEENPQSPNQDQSHISSRDVVPSLSQAPKSGPNYAGTPIACKGKRITINIDDIRVLYPKSYSTLLCPKTCRVCSNGQCYRRSCKPARHRQLRAVIKMPSGKTSFENLSGHEVITACGC